MGPDEKIKGRRKEWKNTKIQAEYSRVQQVQLCVCGNGREKRDRKREGERERKREGERENERKKEREKRDKELKKEIEREKERMKAIEKR